MLRCTNTACVCGQLTGRRLLSQRGRAAPLQQLPQQLPPCPQSPAASQPVLAVPVAARRRLHRLLRRRLCCPGLCRPDLRRGSRCHHLAQAASERLGLRCTQFLQRPRHVEFFALNVIPGTPPIRPQARRVSALWLGAAAPRTAKMIRAVPEPEMTIQPRGHRVPRGCCCRSKKSRVE